MAQHMHNHIIMLIECVWRKRAFTPHDRDHWLLVYWLTLIRTSITCVENTISIFVQFITPTILDNVAILLIKLIVRTLMVLWMYFRMGIVKMAGNRLYWEKHLRYEPVASIMTRDRLWYIMKSIHFIDNLSDGNDYGD